MPRVFIDGTCIGGGDETVALHRDQLKMESTFLKEQGQYCT